jgi:hypothetical protein
MRYRATTRGQEGSMMDVTVIITGHPGGERRFPGGDGVSVQTRISALPC